MTESACARKLLPAHGLSPQQFRNALGQFPSGITVVSGIAGKSPLGFTCQSFYSVSMDPPLVSFSVMASSTTYPQIRDTGSFVVNVLAKGQHGVSDQFARSGTDKWAGIGWSPSPNGNPVIAGSLMWIDCEIWAEHEAGDHTIVIGQVRDISSAEVPGQDPLLFYKGRYHHLADEPAL